MAKKPSEESYSMSLERRILTDNGLQQVLQDSQDGAESSDWGLVFG